MAWSGQRSFLKLMELKIYNASALFNRKKTGKKFIVGDTGAGYAGKILSMATKNSDLNVKFLWGQKIQKTET